MARRHRRKAEERLIARRRIARLFALAHERMLEGEGELADRAARLGRRIAMRYQTGLSPSERDRLCRRCNSYLAPGRTARVRVGDGMKRITCLRCGAVYRRPYLREQKERRRSRQPAAEGPAHDQVDDEAAMSIQPEGPQ